eukprot:TRINITY_DN845_c0_g1_i2.p1 TRINITY_DN845_c0_g1~~TRINITY_DN845_c0_g1_i2.p1  ORF type:complete len:124 (+),score=15.51 TRINITY_DN845_c0_g1_i2:483-854(+)
MLVGEKGKVVSLDIYPELLEKTRHNIMKNHADLLNSGIIETRNADGWFGASDEAPFDAIHVGAGAENMPRALVEQLKPGARMVIPVGPEYLYQNLKCVDKDEENKVSIRNITECRFVPLQHVS